jgi:hypothetical protein
VVGIFPGTDGQGRDGHRFLVQRVEDDRSAVGFDVTTRHGERLVEDGVS